MPTTNFTPRVIAVLCALRQGPLGLRAVCHRIGDASTAATEALIRDVAALQLVVWVGSISLHLTHDGLAWLQGHGLDAAPEAVA